MITRQDCLLLLSELKDDGVNVNQEMKDLIKSQTPSIELIKFINEHRQLDLSRFYDKLRKSYNAKKSNLYINIVKEIEDTNEVLTTLSALQTQILIFAKNTEDRQMFLKHSRCEEIANVLLNYYKTYDLTNCIKLIKLIKADLKCLDNR